MRSFILGLMALILAACTTGDKVSNLETGMTPQQVVAILGRPDGQSRQGNQLGYQYTNRFISGWSPDKADYSLIFTDDRLTSWGTGQVRQGGNVGVLTVVPFPQ